MHRNTIRAHAACTVALAWCSGPTPDSPVLCWGQGCTCMSTSEGEEAVKHASGRKADACSASLSQPRARRIAFVHTQLPRKDAFPLPDTVLYPSIMCTSLFLCLWVLRLTKRRRGAPFLALCQSFASFSAPSSSKEKNKTNKKKTHMIWTLITMATEEGQSIQVSPRRHNINLQGKRAEALHHASKATYLMSEGITPASSNYINDEMRCVGISQAQLRWWWQRTIITVYVCFAGPKHWICLFGKRN